MLIPFRTIRLRKHADYGLVYGVSRKLQSASLSFFYRVRVCSPPSDVEGEASSSRFGITVPRVLGPAVLRNRIKRRLRAVARAMMHLLPRNTDVVLHPRPIVATMPASALQSELEAVFMTVARRIALQAINTPLPRAPRHGKVKASPATVRPS